MFQAQETFTILQCAKHCKKNIQIYFKIILFPFFQRNVKEIMNEWWELFTLQWFLFKTDIGVNNVLPYSFEAKVHILTILQNINICDSQYGDSFLSLFLNYNHRREKLCFILFYLGVFWSFYKSPKVTTKTQSIFMYYFVG